MPDIVLFKVFCGVVIAKLCYADSASTDDKQQLNAFIQWSIYHGYCPPPPTSTSLILSDTAHDNLFQQVLNDPNHVLAPLLPNRIFSQYNLRPKQHACKVYDHNFIIRVLYKDVYWLYCTSLYYIRLSTYVFSSCVHDALCHHVIKRIWMNEWRGLSSCAESRHSLTPAIMWRHWMCHHQLSLSG